MRSDVSLTREHLFLSWIRHLPVLRRCRRTFWIASGPAIAYHNNETLTKAFPERFYLSENLHKVVEAGKRSFYGPDGKLDPEVEALLTVGDKQLTPQEVRNITPTASPTKSGACSTRVSRRHRRISTWR